MNNNRFDETSLNGDGADLPVFVETELTRKLQITAETVLNVLVDRADLNPADDEFYNIYMTFLGHYDRLQQELLNASEIKPVCTEGCSSCCCHWVDDLNSFEARIISRYLSENYPGLIDAVKGSLREDIKVFSALKKLISDKLAEDEAASAEITDTHGFALSCFYQMERHCPLLDENGSCIIYPVRPLTCRDYLNLRHSESCLPERINEAGDATLVLYLSDTISEQLEILHKRFYMTGSDTSFRALLLRVLEQDSDAA